MKYKGYKANLVFKESHIEGSLVLSNLEYNFTAHSLEDLYSKFKDCVEEYLDNCKDLNINPEVNVNYKRTYSISKGKFIY